MSLTLAATLAAAETAGGGDWSANVADRGERFAFLPWEEADALSSKDAPTCVSAESVHWDSVRCELDVWLAEILPAPAAFHFNCLFGEQKCTFLVSQGTSGGNFFWKREMQAEVFSSLSVRSLCAIWIVIIIGATFLDENFEMPKEDSVGPKPYSTRPTSQGGSQLAYFKCLQVIPFTQEFFPQSIDIYIFKTFLWM